MAGHLPALLAVAAGLLSCTIPTDQYERKFSKKQIHENSICNTTPGLSKAQIGLCFRQPKVMDAVLKGLQEAVTECQFQFQHSRWNCSSLSAKKRNPYTSAIFAKGFKETAFIHALFSASVVMSVAKACSQGTLKNCACDRKKYKTNPPKPGLWKWKACHHNVNYGKKIAKKFLDPKDPSLDLHSNTISHNNKMGRKIVASSLKVRCKCHGMSGSCNFETCWHTIPGMRMVGTSLKSKYNDAILVQQTNLVKKRAAKLKQWAQIGPKRGLQSNLIYYENSPNFCDENRVLDVFGTAGRACNLSHNDEGSCSALCCGRGHNLIRQRRTESCNCRFHWCCTVECQSCTIEEWVSNCK